MDFPNQNIDELLSSKLDGVLSAVDAEVLTSAMAKDPSLSEVLGELEDAKKLLVSGRSTKKLRANFSTSVVRSAQKRGAGMGESAPAWLLGIELGESKLSSLIKISEQDRSRRWLGAGALALAATLFLVWLAVPSTMRNEIASVREQSFVEQNKGEPSSTNVNSSVIAANPIGVELGHVAKTEVPNALFPIDSSKFDLNKDRGLNSSGPVIVAPVIVAPVIVAESDSGILEAKRAEEAQGTPIAYADPAKTEAKEKLFYTMILDVSIDPKAVENRSLERILETYNIVYTDDLVIDDSQLKSLEESRLVGGASLVGGDSLEEKMGVMFLRSTAKKLDLAIRDIINRFEDFPDFALDITTDSAAKMLVKQLGGIQVAEGSDGFARRLSVGKASGDSSPFASSMRRGKPMPLASRSTYKGGMISESSQNDDLSNVLFLLRQAKK